MASISLSPPVESSNRQKLRLDETTTTLTTPSGTEVTRTNTAETLRERPFEIQAGDVVEVVAPRRALAGKPRKVELIVDSYGETVRVPVSDGVAKLTVPDWRGMAKFGFEVTARSGEVTKVDSVGYRAHVVPSEGATLVFRDDWTHETLGTLQAGERLEIAYDADRLEKMLGNPASDLKVCIEFDGKDRVELPLSAQRGGITAAEPTYMPALQIPYTARQAKVWFEGRAGEKLAYDSNYCRDYHFDIIGPRPNSHPDWKGEVLRRGTFENLKAENFEVLGGRDDRYDCFAWSLGQNTWVNTPGNLLEDFDRYYEKLGYRIVDTRDTGLVPGTEKIALYGVELKKGKISFKHVARMNGEGLWESKLGKTEHLIAHKNLGDLEGDFYGTVQRMYARPRTGP